MRVFAGQSSVPRPGRQTRAVPGLPVTVAHADSGRALPDIRARLEREESYSGLWVVNVA
jgi:hypothetical protein